jgi:WD40 repeat protein
VLPTKKSELAGSFVVLTPEGQNYIFTVGVLCLIRQWDLETGECVQSYPLETPETGGSEKKRIQFCSLDPTNFYLLVAFQGGLVQVNDIYTGQTLYNKVATEALNLDQEVTNVKWLGSQSSQWFICTCWEGQVAFFSQPVTLKGRQFLTCKKVNSLHRRDVLTLDITQKMNLVTGSVDNIICFWKMFDFTISKDISLPFAAEGNQISHLCFPDPNMNELLLVFM